MSKLSGIIHPIEGFQYSVNIAYDLSDDNKIKAFIPTSGTLHIIEDILSSVNNKSTDRARLLTGAYGKGKSHLILYIIAMLSGRNATLFTTAIKKAAGISPDLSKNIESFLDSGKKLLPVVVNAASLDLKTNLLQSLNTALKQAQLESLMPSTFFDSAVDKIKSWQKDYPATYKEFERKIGQSGEDFIRTLKDYNQENYNLFIKIYPFLTSGSEFNPMSGADVIAVYEAVIKAIKVKGYSGIFVVYDEFGKFLEGSVDKSSAMDIKLIQDFAEKCNRSGADQLHLLLISHKSIENYLGNLPKNKVDAWKAVSNRFKSISIENDENEIYDMVSTVLARNDARFKNYVKQNETSFDKLKSIIDKDQSFYEIRKTLGDKLALRCYPLHPYTLLLLPKISELVAQNERTIFTFLSSTERYSIPYFLKTNEDDFPIVEPDYIYDYFEGLFKNEPFGSNVKKQWQIATAALSKLREADNPLAEKIVKTIALIYCADDFKSIPPSWDIIADVYSINYSIGQIESAKEVLKNYHILIELLYRPYVRITAGSGHNALELIQQECYKISNTFNAKTIFNDITPKKYLYPVQYNDENEIVRYFDLRFITIDELRNIPSTGMELDTAADGIVYNILAWTDNDLDNALALIKGNNNQRAVFIIPNEVVDVTPIAKEFKAVSNLITQYSGREIELVDELSYILEDRANILNAYMENTYFRFDKKAATVYYMHTPYNIRRKAKLAQLLSTITTDIYYRTPRIVNDLINRNELTSAIKNARNKLLNALLTNNKQFNLGLQGNGPELNILRSLLITPGIFINSELPYLEYNCKDEKIRDILKEINDFIVYSDRTKTFADLYDILTLPEYHFGLKKGVIPIYITVALLKYTDHIVLLKKDREVPITASTICDIEYFPKDFRIILEQWNNEKEMYISNLENIFADYISTTDKASGSFVYIVKAMRRWYLQLTKYEITTKFYCDEDYNIAPLDSGSIKFREILSHPEINAYDFLFNKLLSIYDTDEYASTIKLLRQSVKKISSSYSNIHHKFIKQTKELFNGNQNEGLSSILENFYDDLKQTTKEHLFNGKVGLFLETIRHPNNNENKTIEAIARIIFNLRMSDFTDEIMSSFVEELSTVKDTILRYNSSASTSSLSGYKITYFDENGQEITRQFDSTEETQTGKYLYNDITSVLSDFNEALSSDEKRQILFRILKELI